MLSLENNQLIGFLYSWGGRGPLSSGLLMVKSFATLTTGLPTKDETSKTTVRYVFYMFSYMHMVSCSSELVIFTSNLLIYHCQAVFTAEPIKTTLK